MVVEYGTSIILLLTAVLLPYGLTGTQQRQAAYLVEL